MKFFLSTVFFLLIVSLSAQEVKFAGTIQNESNGAFLAHALISINSKRVESDSNGAFYLNVSNKQLLHISIRLKGYKAFSEKMYVYNDTVISFFLKSESVNLDEVTIEAEKDNNFGISRLKNIEGTTIYAGKKSEAVYVQDLNANLAANNSRQVYAKVPGINIYENDGTGSSIGVGGRGLDPNRISNFNTRQNGYDISADALGYPESYYTPPTEAIERIEILRGAAGLQFGTQFGGMINYKFTDAPLNKKISGNFRQTTGSYGFFNSFNQLAGTIGKLSYSTFYQFKKYEGWRERSELISNNAFAGLKYQLNENFYINAEYTYLHYVSQQPGGLTDKQFALDNSYVSRKRNWFKVDWNLLSLSANYKMNASTEINFRSFGLLAGRDALGFLGTPNRSDDTTKNRTLLSDKYKNYGAELRLIKRYSLFTQASHFLIGTRYYHGNTDRKQGDADKSADPNFTFLHPDNLENSAYVFPSQNVAVFIENSFQLTKKWNVTPGLRYEYIQTDSEGYYRQLNTNLAGDTLLNKIIPDDRNYARQFILAGIGTQYKFNDDIDVYANISQNYRSINFNDMRVLNPNFQVDPNLKDETGFTADGGFRGSIKNLLYFDLGVFYLQYNNRIGTTLLVDTNTFQIIRYRTNIADSRNLGFEGVVELDWLKLINRDAKQKFSTFANVSFIDARYISDQKIYENKFVEFVPRFIIRTGVTYGIKKFSITAQYSYTDEQYTDATNAISSPTSIYGIIPAYTIVDLSASYTIKRFSIYAGVNNLLNASYFTRRAEGYPGPGIIPADPINFYVTLRYVF